MATLQLTHAPILNSSAQILILPVNTAGIFLDPVLMRTKTLYPDAYKRYHRACRSGSLKVGSCLLHKRIREQAGLGISHNGNQPSYIAYLIISNHPYHPARLSWVKTALVDLEQQLIPLIRDKGVRKIALLAKPLISGKLQTNTEPNYLEPKHSTAANAETLPLDWQTNMWPLLIQHLQHLSKLSIEIHVPKSIDITN